MVAGCVSSPDLLTCWFLHSAGQYSGPGVAGESRAQLTLDLTGGVTLSHSLMWLWIDSP